MQNVRLSNDSLRYYESVRANAKSSSSRTHVSSHESTDSEDEGGWNGWVNNKDQGISPSASQHRSPQLQPSDLGLKPLPPSRQRKNASKVNTPNKILQIALDRKSHNNSEVPLQNQDSVATTASIQPALNLRGRPKRITTKASDELPKETDAGQVKATKRTYKRKTKQDVEVVQTVETEVNGSLGSNASVVGNSGKQSTMGGVRSAKTQPATAKPSSSTESKAKNNRKMRQQNVLESVAEDAAVELTPSVVVNATSDTQIPRRNGRKRLEKVNNDNGEMTSSPNKSSQGKNSEPTFVFMDTGDEDEEDEDDEEDSSGSSFNPSYSKKRLPVSVAAKGRKKNDERVVKAGVEQEAVASTSSRLSPSKAANNIPTDKHARKRSPKKAPTHPVEKAAAEWAKEVEVSAHPSSTNGLRENSTGQKALQEKHIERKETHASLYDDSEEETTEDENVFSTRPSAIITTRTRTQKLNHEDTDEDSEESMSEESLENSPVPRPVKDSRGRPSSTSSKIFTEASENTNQSKASMRPSPKRGTTPGLESATPRSVAFKMPLPTLNVISSPARAVLASSARTPRTSMAIVSTPLKSGAGSGNIAPRESDKTTPVIPATPKGTTVASSESRRSISTTACRVLSMTNVSRIASPTKERTSYITSQGTPVRNAKTAAVPSPRSDTLADSTEIPSGSLVPFDATQQKLHQVTASAKRKNLSNLPLSANKRAKVHAKEDEEERTDSGLIGNLPQGTATVIARERMHSSFRTEEPAVADRTMLKTHNNLGVAPVHASDMDRFNPYQAPGGPVRAQLLLSSETYRVTWLHLQPGSTFSLHTHTSTLATIVEGSVVIKTPIEGKKDVVCCWPNHIVEHWNPGTLYNVINTNRNVPAILQITESLSK